MDVLCLLLPTRSPSARCPPMSAYTTPSGLGAGPVHPFLLTPLLSPALEKSALPLALSCRPFGGNEIGLKSRSALPRPAVKLSALDKSAPLSCKRELELLSPVSSLRTRKLCVFPIAGLPGSFSIRLAPRWRVRRLLLLPTFDLLHLSLLTGQIFALAPSLRLCEWEMPSLCQYVLEVSFTHWSFPGFHESLAHSHQCQGQNRRQMRG
jgi:hypothetical protein